MVNHGAIDRAVLERALGSLAGHLKPEHVEALACALETGERSGRLVHDLTAGQRAMIGARITNRPVGTHRQSLPSAGLAMTNNAAGELLNVHHSLILVAKKLLAHGTPEEIARVERGHGGISAGRKYYSRSSVEIGANPARLAREKIGKHIWRHLRGALEGLTQLPNATECVAIVRARDRHGFVRRTLTPAHQWLNEFAHAYDAADEADDGESRDQSAA